MFELLIRTRLQEAGVGAQERSVLGSVVVGGVEGVVVQGVILQKELVIQGYSGVLLLVLHGPGMAAEDERPR